MPRDSSKRNRMMGPTLWTAVLFGGVAFTLGILTHRGLSARSERPSVLAALPNTDSAIAETSVSRRTIVPEFTPANAVFVCSMRGTEQETLLVDIVKALHQRVQVIVLIPSPKHVEACRRLFSQAGIPKGSVALCPFNANSPWIRDYGPLFAREGNGEFVVVDSTYLQSGESGNAKLAYANDEFAVTFSNWLNLNTDTLPIMLEGGNIVASGDGQFYSTYRVLKANGRRGYNGDRLSNLFRSRFGGMRWRMVPMLRGEPTGHADIFMKFLAKDTVVVGAMDPDSEPENAKLLDTVARDVGKNSTGSLKVFRVPILRTGNNHWRSYCNVVSVNNTVLVPSFTDSPEAVESIAMDVYRKALPNANVVAIRCDSILRYGGLLHCMTFSVPMGVDMTPLQPMLISCP